jgi:hypothetical protein
MCISHSVMRCQYFYFCTSKSRKQSVSEWYRNTRLFHHHLRSTPPSGVRKGMAKDWEHITMFFLNITFPINRIISSWKWTTQHDVTVFYLVRNPLDPCYEDHNSVFLTVELNWRCPNMTKTRSIDLRNWRRDERWNTYMLDLGEDNPFVYSKFSQRENNKDVTIKSWTKHFFSFFLPKTYQSHTVLHSPTRVQW